MKASKKDPKKFGKVAVLMGGLSAEREISIMSGEQVLKAMLELGINAYKIDVNRNIATVLQADKPDRVFIALHGTYGEDGAIQGLLEILGIPYTTSGVAASALTMDKWQTNVFLEAFDIPIIPSVLLNKKTTIEEIIARFKLPLCIKPTASGSSCGISKITGLEEIANAYELASKYSKEVIVEPWINGSEYTVGILNDKALPIIKIVVPDGFYDYEAKYFKDSTQYLDAKDLSSVGQKQLQDIALKVFRLTRCRYWGRVDFIKDDKGKFWLLEINTVPGLTEHSLVPKAASKIGISFSQLIWQILEASLEQQ